MKKLVLVFCLISLFSCTNNEISSEAENITKDNNEHIYYQDITIDNLWYFFDYEISGEILNGSTEELYASFNGLLLIALYDNIIINFTLKYSFNDETKFEKHSLKLKSNGNGYFSLSCYYVTLSEVSLQYCIRSLEIDSVEGKVIYY